MRVAALRWSRFRIPFRAPYETAHGAASHREGVIVRLLTDAGLEGLGEASLDPAAPAGAAGIGDRLDAVAPRLQGRPLTDAMSELDRRPSADEAGRAARFALETAVRDVAAKAAEQRLAACLVPGSRSAVAVNATIASCARPKQQCAPPPRPVKPASAP